MSPAFWTRLSRVRKESSTAFLAHWLTIHSPLTFSAIRSLPASRSAITDSMILMASVDWVVSSVRFSHSSSMVACSGWLM